MLFARIFIDLQLQLCLIAVPLFYIVSLYLFFQKPELPYFKKRLIRLVKLYLFWSVFQNIFYIIATKQLPAWSWDIITGLQPSLPLVGDSVFYFLFNLMVLLIFAFLYQMQSKKFKLIVSYILVGFSLFYFEALYFFNSNLPYHWLINFLIYIPIAFYLVNNPEKILKFKGCYLITYILFSLHDIYLRIYNQIPSIYGRVSIVFGALTIFCYVYSPQNNQKSLLVEKLAKYSLGLFAIHKYWQYLFVLLLQKYKIAMTIGVFGIPLNIVFLVESVFVVFLTILSIYLLKSTPFKRFVT
ncbi:acyltransferase family protein [Scytonema sp. UIC 10036]|uniref:acyltransferase family protein n=1 Tax=Scytonema sp. UIC 10036 TaxID=2304196 RepID=UPI0012DA8283|nr:acyltransferase family protein [Scytonema sp. UIC 10036]MUH00485.1 acyltransferase family protein [Scytonema sp. UIC 10036]